MPGGCRRVGDCSREVGWSPAPAPEVGFVVAVLSLGRCPHN